MAYSAETTKRHDVYSGFDTLYSVFSEYAKSELPGVRQETLVVLSPEFLNKQPLTYAHVTNLSVVLKMLRTNEKIKPASLLGFRSWIPELMESAVESSRGFGPSFAYAMLEAFDPNQLSHEGQTRDRHSSDFVWMTANRADTSMMRKQQIGVEILVQGIWERTRSAFFLKKRRYLSEILNDLSLQTIKTDSLLQWYEDKLTKNEYLYFMGPLVFVEYIVDHFEDEFSSLTEEKARRECLQQFSLDIRHLLYITNGMRGTWADQICTKIESASLSGDTETDMLTVPTICKEIRGNILNRIKSQCTAYCRDGRGRKVLGEKHTDKPVVVEIEVNRESVMRRKKMLFAPICSRPLDSLLPVPDIVFADIEKIHVYPTEEGVSENLFHAIEEIRLHGVSVILEAGRMQGMKYLWEPSKTQGSDKSDTHNDGPACRKAYKDPNSDSTAVAKEMGPLLSRGSCMPLIPFGEHRLIAYFGPNWRKYITEPDRPGLCTPSSAYELSGYFIALPHKKLEYSDFFEATSNIGAWFDPPNSGR
jgi:hypothetical protein